MVAGVAACAVIGGAGACSNASAGAGASGCPNLDLSCPSTPPSWKTDVQPIINGYCATGGCHVPGGISPFPYTTYADVQMHAARMIVQLQRCYMPPSDASLPAKPLPDAERQTLMHWLNCGAPDN